MNEPPELLPVPTVAQLVTRGIARNAVVDKDGRVTLANVTPEGNRLMVEAMMENGRRMRAYAEAHAVPRETLPPAPSPPPDDAWPAWE